MHIVKVQKGSKEWVLKANDLKKPLEYVPGGVKMAMSTVGLALIVWTFLQFGSEFSRSISNADAFTIFRWPVSLQPFVGWYHKSADDNYGTLQLLDLRDVDDKISTSVAFGKDIVDGFKTLETNLDGSGVKVQSGTPMHGQLIDSYPVQEALLHGRDSAIAVKASMQLMYSLCLEPGVPDEQCARYITALKLPTAADSTSEESDLQLGDKCAAHHGSSLSCSRFSKYRSINGSCNHLTQPAWGQAFTGYRRLLFPSYSDGIQAPRQYTIGQPKNKHNLLPSARLVSSGLAVDDDLPDSIKTLAIMQWAQFVEHDLAHTPFTKKLNNFESSIMCCAEDGWNLSPRYVHPACMPISIPHNDPFYSKRRMTCMNYVRSVTAMRPDCNFGPAEQMNQASHYLDGSMIYGSTDSKAAKLRLYSKGHLKHTIKDAQVFLPSAEEPTIQCQLDPTSQACYDAGDGRVNAHPHLTVMHTLWLRQHNHIADKLAELNPSWDDEKLYQEARRIVIAQIQHITYHEWLPLILGDKYTKKFGLTSRKEGFSKEYSENVDPSITNSFATAALRFVHSLMEGRLRLVTETRRVNHTILLRDHFNRPRIIEETTHLDSFVRGLATQNSQKNDMLYTQDITNLLYQDSDDYGLDIISLDVQRGRDHGLPGYNQFRKICGLQVATSFNDFNKEIPKAIVQRLRNMYRHPDDVDLLIGGMAERSKDDSLLGPTFRCIIGEQFGRTKKGDRFFYDLQGQSGSFTEDQLQEIRKVSLARIFCDNSGVETMQPSIFHKPSSSNKLERCSNNYKIPAMDLSFWAEDAGNH